MIPNLLCHCTDAIIESAESLAHRLDMYVRWPEGQCRRGPSRARAAIGRSQLSRPGLAALGPPQVAAANRARATSGG